ncbi:MAG: hypothetical protein LBM06_02455 [Prevotellaceae bacterium]|jgi:Tol biopolymer transport system component|nr:hypothetical protein [Prevotellaceae bacterium]
MRNSTLIGVAWLMATFTAASAQEITILSLKKVSIHQESYHPTFTPDGQRLVITASDYAGLRSYNLSSGQESVLTTASGAGYNYRYYADRIIYRVNTFRDHRKYVATESCSLLTGETKQLVAATRATSPQVAADFAKQLQADTYVTIEDRHIALYTRGAKKILTPNGTEASYLWPSISPDGKRLVYTVAGSATFVCDIDGQNAVSVGEMNAPKWLSNQWVIGMDDRDDGHRVTGSAIVAVRTDGSARQQLTDQSLVAMYPAAAPDGKQIAFNTDRGEIYLLTIQLP